MEILSETFMEAEMDYFNYIDEFMNYGDNNFYEDQYDQESQYN